MRIKVPALNLIGPVLIGSIGIFAWQYRNMALAKAAGIIFLLTFAIGAYSVKPVGKGK